MRVPWLIGGSWPRVRRGAGHRGQAGANDEWFVLGRTTIKATDPSVGSRAKRGGD